MRFRIVRPQCAKYFTLAMVAMLLFSMLKASGAILLTYDLDSLVHMSPQIVEGRIIGQHWQNNFEEWEVEISKTHAGSFAFGQKVNVTALADYCVSGRENWKLEKGDELFLFLDRAKPIMPDDVSTNTEIYGPVPSGVRLVARGKAVEFWQGNNPGPYVARTAGVETNVTVPEVAEFRRQIHESIGRVAHWNQLLRGQPTKPDIPALLGLLRERSSHQSRGEDEISVSVCSRLAELHEPNALLEASLIRPGHPEAPFVLGQGLATAEGRKLLLDKIADLREPLDNRLRWASLVFEATPIVGPTSFFEYGRADQTRPGTNEHYLRRIAELATDVQSDTNLQPQLLRTLSALAGVSGSGELVKTDDGAEAEAIMKIFSTNTLSEELRYATELILYPLSRARTNTGFGPIIAILQPAPPNYLHTAGELAYGLNYYSDQKGSWTLRLALVDLKTGEKKSVFVPNITISGPTTGGMGRSIAMPPDLPHDRYRLYMEFMEGEKVVATSHYFEADL